MKNRLVEIRLTQKENVVLRGEGCYFLFTFLLNR